MAPLLALRHLSGKIEVDVLASPIPFASELMAVAPTVLLVDDDAEILSAMETVLARRGYHVLTAYDGNMGLALAERESPDLVICDMMMPKKSGFLVLETLKARKGGPKVIMITANEGSRHKAYAEMLGADDYVRKPFEMAKLLEAAERLCPVTSV
jgi:DNA-binding response OmpR family regulator